MTIQQERQDRLAEEVKERKRWGEEASEKMRKLEQNNETLRWRLQAMGNGGNDFMGGFYNDRRPPDVY